MYFGSKGIILFKNQYFKKIFFLQKCHKIFLHILLLQNILVIFFRLELFCLRAPLASVFTIFRF